MSRFDEKKMKKEYRKSVDRMVTDDIKKMSTKLRERCNMYRLISILEFAVICGLIGVIYAFSF